MVSNLTTNAALVLALNISNKTPSETLGNCLPHNMDDKDFESIIQFLYDAIENQYYEDAPNRNTQDFLDKILFIKKNYVKIKG